MGGNKKGDNPPGDQVSKSGSIKVIKAADNLRGSIASQDSTGAGSLYSRSRIGITSSLQTKDKDKDDDDRTVETTTSTTWDDHFKVVDGKRVSVLTQASYALVTQTKAKPHIGLIGCIIVVVGCVLGTGIFAAPDAILAQTDNASLALLIWGIYGFIATIAALCYVELGCTFPLSGGDYAYLNECFGSLAAFLFQWAANLVSLPCILAIMSQIAAKNLVSPYLSETNDPRRLKIRDWTSRLLATSIILSLGYVNCKSPKLTEKIRGVFMGINVTAICLVITCGMIYIGSNGVYRNDDFKIALPNPPLKPNQTLSQALIVKFQTLQIVRSLFTASFSYLGYSRLGYIAEEVINPTRNLPLGICLSMPIIIALNVFVNFCYFETLDKEVLKNTRTVASEMLRAVLPPEHVYKALWIAPTLVAIAVLGSLSGHLLTSSRLAFAGARNGHFPRIFGLIHYKNGTPNVSIIFIVLSTLLYIFMGQVRTLISVAVYLETIFNCSCVYGLIYLRFTRKDLYRPFKLPLVLPIFYASVATCLFIIPIIALDGDTYEETLAPVGGAIAVLITGIPMYFIFVRNEKNCVCQCLRFFQFKLTLFLQKLLLVVPEEGLDTPEDDEMNLAVLTDDSNNPNRHRLRTSIHAVSSDLNVAGGGEEA